MATYNIGNRKHLTLADRAAIEHGIQIGENFSQIARKLNKDSSTISKEIRRHIIHRSRRRCPRRLRSLGQ